MPGLPDPAQFPQQQPGSGDRPRADRRQAAIDHRLHDDSSGENASNALPTPAAWAGQPTTDLGRHPRRVPAADDLDVHHVGVHQHRQVHRLPADLAQVGHVGQRHLAELALPGGQFAQLEQLGAEFQVGPLGCVRGSRGWSARPPTGRSSTSAGRSDGTIRRSPSTDDGRRTRRAGRPPVRQQSRKCSVHRYAWVDDGPPGGHSATTTPPIRTPTSAPEIDNRTSGPGCCPTGQPAHRLIGGTNDHDDPRSRGPADRRQADRGHRRTRQHRHRPARQAAAQRRHRGALHDRCRPGVRRAGPSAARWVSRPAPAAWTGCWPRIELPDLVFEATSAKAHIANAARYAEAGITAIDLTPAAVGPFVCPAVNADVHAGAPNINMITCGGQATIPIVQRRLPGDRRCRTRRSSPRSPPARPARAPGPTSTSSPRPPRTRSRPSAARQRGKAIIILNPVSPPMIMRDTVFCAIGPDADRDAISRIDPPDGRRRCSSTCPATSCAATRSSTTRTRPGTATAGSRCSWRSRATATTCPSGPAISTS